MNNALSDSALDQLFRNARSYNGFRDEPVTMDQLHAIWNPMRSGPTSANSLPARIAWCASTDAKAQLATCVLPTNVEKILSAPVTAIIGMDTEFFELLPELFPHADARSWFSGNTELSEATAFRNATLQGAYLVLAARALGLDTGPISGFDHAAVDAAFFSGQPSVRSNFIATIGYGDPASIFARRPPPPVARRNRIG